MTSLGIKRQPGESWRDCAIRIGRQYGLEHEVTEDYDAAIARGETEEEAAWGACYEWDVCEIIK